MPAQGGMAPGDGCGTQNCVAVAMAPAAPPPNRKLSSGGGPSELRTSKSLHAPAVYSSVLIDARWQQGATDDLPIHPTADTPMAV